MHNEIGMDSVLNPGLRQLIRFQTTAKCRRMLRGFSSPRRLCWSVVATVLAMLWLSNAAMSILFRRSADIERFQSWIPLGLLVYASWHVIKVVCHRPEEPIEWTSAERELLCGGPYRRSELILYRLASITNAALIKAVCFTLLMLPDLTLFGTGFVGTFLALLFLDLLRMALEITAHGMSPAVYVRVRWTVVAIVTGIVVSSFIIALSTPVTWQLGPASLSLGLIMHLFRSAASLVETPVGLLAKAPFEVFSQLITATEYSLATFGWFVLASTMVLGGLLAIVSLDRHYHLATQQRERTSYPETGGQDPHSTITPAETVRLTHISWLAGAGPIAWRQLMGALRYRSSLMFALALPGILACMPIVVVRDGKQALLNVAGALVFYTFLLLPSALKFDFRRDIERMVVFKMLPIGPVAIAVGQIMAPVVLAFAFQCIVLGITFAVRPYPIWMMFAVLTLLLPLNVLIFALDNLVYLLYPYRLNQEGIEIFLRTTLIFTAKGVLFTAGVAVAFGWSFAANFLARSLLGSANDAAIVFVIGGWLLLTAMSIATLHGLSQAFARFDPSQDTPS